MRRIQYLLGTIIIIILIGTISFSTMNGATIHCVNSLRDEPCDEEIIGTYLAEFQNDSTEVKKYEKYLLGQKGFTLVNEKTRQYSFISVMDNKILNIYYPILLKKDTLLYEVYYLNENDELIRYSDNECFGKISVPK